MPASGRLVSLCLTLLCLVAGSEGDNGGEDKEDVVDVHSENTIVYCEIKEIGRI